jgi:hypothetical protein
MASLGIAEGLVDAGDERVLILNPHELVVIAEELDS